MEQAKWKSKNKKAKAGGGGGGGGDAGAGGGSAAAKKPGAEEMGEPPPGLTAMEKAKWKSKRRKEMAARAAADNGRQ